jgi:Tol biopolymer transport system component
VTLRAGTMVGSYELLALLGAGAMGEVYRARDTRLNRDVAVKILPGPFADDVDRLARFERESHVLASLNHPNIAAIYGVEETGPLKALVLELVDGPTLADRIAHGPIPFDDAWPIAKQIAEALEAAHEHGIVHRDLKPANVKIRDAGTVKVLDFGLAKALDPTASSIGGVTIAPTRSGPGTKAGIILGTAAYMAPEQARGKAVDKRADIWAFGVLLFEMIAGRRAFEGETFSDVLAKVIEREPDWSALPPATPVIVHTLLARCLKKDPKTRLRDIGEARVHLEELLGATEDTGASAIPRTRPLWQRALPWAVAIALGVLALLLWSPWRRSSASPAPIRLSAELGADAALVTARGAGAILSPDGSVLAFVAEKNQTSQLYVRRLAQVSATPMAGTDGASGPFFSPDGRWIAFFAGGRLKKVLTTGGAPIIVCDAPEPRGGAWAEDGTIVFMPGGGTGLNLFRVPSAGGTPRPLTTPDRDEVTQRWPQVLPGGKALLYTGHSRTGGYEDANLVVQPLPAGARKVVQRGGYYGRYVPSGHLVYVHDGSLFAAPFDLDRLELSGPVVPVLESVSASPEAGWAQFAFSQTGTLVYVPKPSAGSGEVPISWMNRNGTTTPLRSTPTNWSNLVFSPDGRRLAMGIFDGRQGDVWVYDWPRDAATRLTFDATDNQSPIWTPDGRRIVFTSRRADNTTLNMYWQRVDGGGDVQRLTESRNPQQPSSWHPSGKFMAFFELNPHTGDDLMILPMDGDEASEWRPGTPTVFLNSPASEIEPMFSPDGRWIAYLSNESGRYEVHVRPFPGPGGQWQISTGGGASPTWSRTRHELFYGSPDGHIVVTPYTVDGDSFRAEKSRLWSDARYVTRPRRRSFDLHPDGERFALAKAMDAPAAATHDHVTFMLNIFDELRRIAPVTRR